MGILVQRGGDKEVYCRGLQLYYWINVFHAGTCRWTQQGRYRRLSNTTDLRNETIHVDLQVSDTFKLPALHAISKSVKYPPPHAGTTTSPSPPSKTSTNCGASPTPSSTSRNPLPTSP